MKTLEKDELYQNLQGFLKAKGVELKEGSYVSKIQKSCALLSDAINTSQRGLKRAKVEIDNKLDQLRQVIHEKTAPARSRSTPPKAETQSKANASNSQTGSKARKAGKRSRAQNQKRREGA